MHAALEAPDPARPEREPRSQPADAPPGARRPRLGGAALWLAGLAVVVALSVADGLIGSVVAYERDTTVFYFPLMAWVAQRLHHGELPLWTPQVFGGYPIFADGEIGLAYPPVLLALLALPPERALVVLRLVHLTIAAFGTFALARAWRLPYASAALAGVVFALGNFLSAQIHHENIVRTASWLPLMLALVERALQQSDWRRRLRRTLLAAAALGLAGLSLHSQMLAIALLILTGYAAFRWAVGPLPAVGVGRRWLDRLASVARVCGPMVALGIGLAAIQLLPLVELAGFSLRGRGIPYAESAAYSVTPYGLVQLIFPYVFRSQSNHQWGLWTHWESYLYIGLVPLLLTIVALVCVRRREVAGWGLVGGVGLLLSLGQYSPINLHYVLWLLPGLSGLRAPGRFSLVVVLAGAMLAAYGLAWLQGLSAASLAEGEDASVAAQSAAGEVDLAAPTGARGRQRLRQLLVRLGIGVGLLTMVLVTTHLVVLAWPEPVRQAIQFGYLSLSRDSYPLTASDVLSGLRWSTDLANPRTSGALLGLVASLAAVWLWHYSRRARLRAWRGWPALLVGVTSVDLLLFAWSIHPREPLSRLMAEPPAVEAVAQQPTLDAAPSRILASPILNQVAADRLAPFDGVQEANGYSSLQFMWHRDYLGRVLYADDGLLDLWNVRYVLDPASYGALAGYRGVNFLNQQALLHGPGGSPLGQQQFALTGGASISELRLVSALQGAVDLPQGTPVAEVELHNAAGELVGTAELQAGRDTMDWAWALPNVQPNIKHQPVEHAGVAFEGSTEPRERQLSFADFGFAAPVEATTLTVRTVLPTGEFALYGGAALGTDGSIQQLFGRTKTKYRQIYADSEIRVLENTGALPRAFVVPRARVAASLGTALSEMVHQPFDTANEVILADDATIQATPVVTERGGRGSARITGYTADEVRVHTSATADAWLVLSDTYYPGWAASVDGQPTQVLRGDVLFRVIAIPGGEHEVDFQFRPASVKFGLPISLASLALLGLLAVLSLGLVRRRGERVQPRDPRGRRS